MPSKPVKKVTQTWEFVMYYEVMKENLVFHFPELKQG